MAFNIDPNKTDKLGQIILDIKCEFREHKARFITRFIGTLLGSMFLTSLVVEWWMTVIGQQDALIAVHFMSSWVMNGYSLFLWFLMIIVIIKIQIVASSILKKDYVHNEEENYDASIYGVYGDAHWQTETERKDCFNLEKDINNVKGDILGIDPKGRIYSLRDDLLGINKNKIFFGSAGSGKSAAVAENEIFQAIIRGDSIIVTDSKGDLYRNTSKIGRKYGYIIRVLNLKAKELKNSDAWDALKYVTLEDDIQAEVLAKAIINNTQEGPMDYWADNEMNCLKALLLYVATNEQYIKTGRNRMDEVANLFNSYDADGLSSLFSTLPPTHPAKTAFNKFDLCEGKVKAQILNGMSIRLSLLDNKYIKNIVSHDEIDLILPMKKKCIYYIVISDTDTSTKFMASMFFTQLFMEQCDYSDSLPKKYKKEHQLRVKYVLDEFANIGAIPFFDVKISTFRSRKIEATLIMQSVSQLKNMYPHDVDQTILGNITIKGLLKAGDTSTAKYFSELCGVLTTKVTNGKYSRAKSNILDTHDEQSISEGLGKRELMLPDKAMKLDADTVVICILGFQPIKLNKFIAELRHPMYKEIEEAEPNRHLPKWRKELQDKEKELKERRDAYFHKKGEEPSEPDASKVEKPAVSVTPAEPVTTKRPKTAKPNMEPPKVQPKPAAPVQKPVPSPKPTPEVKPTPAPVMKVTEIDMDDIPDIGPQEPEETTPSKPASRLEKATGKRSNAVTSIFD